MPRITIGVGVLLAIIGLGAYFGSGGASVTAMIPAFFGVPLLLLGLAALKPGWRAASMHVAAIVALLGLVGAVYRPIKTLAGGETLDFNSAVTTQLVMAAICAVFIVACVMSFMKARRPAAT